MITELKKNWKEENKRVDEKNVKNKIEKENREEIYE